MPTEATAQKLAQLVKTTQAKREILNQAHDLVNDLVATTPPSNREIQSNYPLLYELLDICYPNTSVGLEQLVSDLNSLDEVVFTTAPKDTITETELFHWASENISRSLLVNKLNSKEMVAGVTMSYKGRLANLSLDKTLKEKVYG